MKKKHSECGHMVHDLPSFTTIKLPTIRRQPPPLETLKIRRLLDIKSRKCCGIIIASDGREKYEKHV
ncbi:hypothetical protein NECAME_15167 [Necator americanus]|uniref:Uncharacterized protein n=1 Tax=Necator americanus TaxID=51031 RepID=W2SLQ8_NECAM|nr:hypothetical protein NECAME_15167 [Necator americanus]ETN69667.1 hypothetical protein NECAME_15167 [Necator americanus]